EEVCAKITNQLVFNLLGEEVTKINVEMNFNGKNFINIFKNHENYYEEICVKTHHSKPIPGQKAVKKIGYKTNSNKDFYCKEGKRHLESTKTIVISESQTIKEINSYGKDAKGKYKGLGVKDDTSITVLMLSRWIEQEEYKIWLQDLYDNLPQTTNKNYADMLLNAYVDPEDNSLIDIDMYIQNENEHMINLQKQLISQQQQTNYQYKPFYR
ncbi:MAG: hypothetical protein RSF67_03025, partial [Clostridia bacterium]